MVAAYEAGGRRECHLLEPDPALPYQVFARDSSVDDPGGAVITQLHQSWRRGEYAAVIRFYEEAEIPIRGMITAGPLEGGDVMILEPGLRRDRRRRGAHRRSRPPASSPAGWRSDGWEVRVEPIPSASSTSTSCSRCSRERLAAVCADVLSAGFVTWLRGRGFELIEVPADDAFQLGGNAISLGDERVLSIAGADALNAQLRARGLTVSRARPVDVHPGRRRRPLPCAGASPPARRGRMSDRAGDRRRPGDRRPARARSAAPAGPTGPSGVCWSAGWRAGALAARRAARRDRRSSPSATRPETSGPGWRATPSPRWRSAPISTRCPRAAGSTARSA